MKKTLTLVLTLVMVMSLAFGMFACAPAAPAATAAPASTEEAAPAAATEAPVAEPTSATVCVGSEPATLDPNMNEAVDGMIYITHLYEGLYRPNTDGSFSLGQAKDVTITDNADGTAHVVATLRDDIFWSDGVPVTAKDFVYSWVRLCDPAIRLQTAPSRRISSASKLWMIRRWSSTLQQTFPTPRTFWRSRA